MYIIVVGGGKVGFHLAKILLSYKHEVVIIEPQAEICEKIANQLYISVNNGDGTTIDKLEEVDAARADILVATTGRDEDNLIACQLAKNYFKIKRTISRVNNPKNIDIFEKLGVDLAVSSTTIIADYIEREIDYQGIRRLTSLKEGRLIISEIRISEHSPVCRKSLKDIELPANSILISVIRDEEIIIPNGFTVLQKDDVIIAASSNEEQDKLKEFFI